MKSRKGSTRWALPTLFLALVIGGAPVNGQLGDLLAAALGGTTPAATPAATAAASATPAATAASTPASTPAGTTAATTTSTPASTPAATVAAATTTTSTTPATTAASTTAGTPASTPAGTTAAAATTSSATPASVANPPATVVLLPGVGNLTATTGTTPRATAKAPPAPPPPVPIVVTPSKLVNALPADELQPLNSSASSSDADNTGVAGVTAADMVVQVSGSGVTPFDVPQQTILLRAAASVLTTVSLGDLRIRYVTSSANINSSGRRLQSMAKRQLMDSDSGSAAAAKKGDLYNVATVTLEANCSSASAVPATLAELQSIMQNNLLASALQSYNATSWGVSLLSLTSVDPSAALDVATPCKKKMGVFCLDHTSLSVATVETLIGIGCFVIIMILCIPCVYLEWSRRSGRMVMLEPTPETPKSPMQKVQQMYNNMIHTVKQVTPMHRKNSNAQNAFRETPRSRLSGDGAKPDTRHTVNLHASSGR